jgi:predicted nucleic acid-binding protein
VSGAVVADASLAVSWVLAEAITARARSLLVGWERGAVERIVPALFASEVNAVLLKRIRQGAISLADAQRAYNDVLAAVTVRPDDAELAPRALDLADSLTLWKAYDTLYLALAERVGCELWTGDERFYNAAHGVYPRVRWVGH